MAVRTTIVYNPGAEAWSVISAELLSRGELAIDRLTTRVTADEVRCSLPRTTAGGNCLGEAKYWVFRSDLDDVKIKAGSAVVSFRYGASPLCLDFLGERQCPLRSL